MTKNTALELSVLMKFSSFAGYVKKFDIKKLPPLLQSAINKKYLRFSGKRSFERIFIDDFLPAMIYFIATKDLKKFNSLEDFVSSGAGERSDNIYLPEDWIWISNTNPKLGKGYELYREFVKKLEANPRYLDVFFKKPQGKKFLKWWLKEK